MLVLCGILNVCAILTALLGLFTPGTGGLAWIGIACLLAILARQCQASHQHQALLGLLHKEG